MAKWARINNNLVAEIISSDPTGKYSSELVWVSCGNNDLISVGWSYSNNTFTAPVPPTKVASSILRPFDFINRFTESELEGIAAASRNSAALSVYLIKLGAVQYIDLNDPVTTGGINLLVSVNLITSKRGADILTP